MNKASGNALGFTREMWVRIPHRVQIKVMAKPPKKKIPIADLPRHLLEKQLAYVGKTWDDVINDPEWYTKYTLTGEQHAEWKEYCIEQIQRTYRIFRSSAEKEFAMFDLAYGLKEIKTMDNNNEVKIDTDKINRVEVINHAKNDHPVGRLLVLYQELGDFKRIEISVQDDQRTLKIFLS